MIGLLLSDLQTGIVIGILFGAIGMMLFSIYISDNRYTPEQIDKFKTDCKIKEYYYLDNHRIHCDRLGVKP